VGVGFSAVPQVAYPASCPRRQQQSSPPSRSALRARNALVRSAPRCRTGEPNGPYLRRCINGALQHHLRDRVRLVRISRREHENGTWPLGHTSLDAPAAGESSLLEQLAASVAEPMLEATLEPLREHLNTALSTAWQEWEIPREAQPTWSDEAKSVHANRWDARIARQKEIDASIVAKADSEVLYDKPYEDKSKVRVAGPFTVESLSPHRTMIVNDDDTISDPLKLGATAEGATDFAQMILNTLRVAGVQQAHKQDRISFESLNGWPGVLLAGKGSYRDADGTLKTAGLFIGPEFGTVTRVDLVEAARECADAGFAVLISCAFNYEAQSTEFDKLGPIPVLKARMNADLHMQQDLANSGKGNLFVIFGDPDIDILDAPDDQIPLKINGVDVFDPSTGEVRSDEPDNIACWFIDSDYNGESFFVHQAYFLGQNDPYKNLKTSLKAEIDQEAWESFNSDVSIPFAKP
jgi:adenine-specific DNA-methyltransferase